MGHSCPAFVTVCCAVTKGLARDVLVGLKFKFRLWTVEFSERCKGGASKAPQHGDKQVQVQAVDSRDRDDPLPDPSRVTELTN